jgi:Flp pilus assembly pilin Flp
MASGAVGLFSRDALRQHALLRGGGMPAVRADPDDAATAVEYAVMLGLILVVCVAAIQALGNHTAAMWGEIDSELQGNGF